ncbi:unnamed protein product [Soboliphyme baturini]|uniref:Ig-like domain-containing protein n=1 Tax=Soboliphyme baturini TaxID=241478 RepID=A0A183JAS3_9BILA|nr:unnamed protein product [Soboliphyme baturini]
MFRFLDDFFDIVSDSTRFTEAIKVVYPVVKQSSIEAALGSNVTFECIFSGVSSPATTWEKYGGELSPDRHTMILGNLLISNVSKVDQGSYICRAVNQGTAGKALLDVALPFIIFSLTVIDPLKVKLTYSIANKREGQHLLELTCETLGGHSPMLFWYFNSKPLLTDGNVLDTKFQGGVFVTAAGRLTAFLDLG